MRAARTCLLLVTGMLLLGGCIQARLVEGRPIAKEHVDRLEIGVTTRQQVLDWFGAPQSFTDLDVLHRMLQETGYVPADVLEAPYADVLVFQLTRADIDGMILIVYSEFDVRVSTDRLIVFFDDTDRVLAWGLAEGIQEDDDEDE